MVQKQKKKTQPKTQKLLKVRSIFSGNLNVK